MTQILIAAITVVVIAVLATKGRRDDVRARREKLAVIQSGGEGTRYGLEMDFGSKVNFIQRVDGVVSFDPGHPNRVIVEEPGLAPDSVPLARIRAIYRGDECLGRW